MEPFWWTKEPHERLPAWERKYPGRIAWELRQLNARGKVVEVRRDVWEIGHFGVDYDWSHAGKTYRLTIFYPGAFPRVRPVVYLNGDRKLFPRKHCDPIDGRLCYLGHAPHEWKPQHSIAELLDEQLPKILEGKYEGYEEEIAEPAEHWWNAYAPDDSCFLIDSAWSVGDVNQGVFRLHYHFADVPFVALRGIATSISDESGKAVASWSGPLPPEFRDSKSIDVPWIRSAEEIYPRNAREVFDIYRGLIGARLHPRRLSDRLFGYLFAVVYPTEIQYKKTGESWVLFIVTGSMKDVKGGREETLSHCTVRTMRAGVDDRTSRSPSSEAIRGRRIAVAGLGAVGAPIALELARNGAGVLDLIDYDRVTPGNSIRWPLGEPVWGFKKPKALSDFVQKHYSQTVVHSHPIDVGERLEDRTVESAQLAEALSQAGLVVEATTSFDILAALFDFCSGRKIPIVSVNATPSVKGGAVAFYAPGGGCPTCLLMHYQDKDSPLSPPPGEGDEGSAVHPAGCAEATFTGASFDLQELSLQAMRTAVHVLSMEPTESFVATLGFVDNQFGRKPEWDIIPFGKHAACCKQ